MKKSLPAIILLSGFALTGCKVDFETEVNLKDLSTKEPILVDGNLNFEVPACASHEDSRKESNSLIELKQNVPTIFREAKFVECYKKKFDSYAHFTVPVNVSAFEKGVKIHDTDIYLYSAASENVIAGIHLNDNLIKRINKYQKDSSNKMEFDFNIKINNNDKQIKPIALSTFIKLSNGETVPSAALPFNWKIANSMTFKLSDVAKDTLLKTGHYTFLVNLEYLTSLYNPQIKK